MQELKPALAIGGSPKYKDIDEFAIAPRTRLIASTMWDGAAFKHAGDGLSR
jgi:hypothetical protein